MNLVTTASPNFGSGRTSRLTAARRRDIAALSYLRPLGAVFRAALAPVLDALGVVRAADDVIAHAGQILDPAAADQHHRVLLQVVALAGDVAGHLEAVGEPHARDLAQRRVRLFRRRRVDARADARASAGTASIAGTLLRAACGLRGLLISWLIVGILTNPQSNAPNRTDSRPTAKRASGGNISLPTEFAPSRKGAVPFCRNRLRLGGILPPAAKRAEYREADLNRVKRNTRPAPRRLAAPA